jgi:hypothetical protein
MSKTLKIVLSLGTLLLSIPLIYVVGWFYFASVIDHEIRLFMKQQEQAYGVLFNGSLSFPDGFPGPYRVRYSGDIEMPEGSLTVPLLQLSGWPLEGQEMTLQAPMGITLNFPDIHEDMRTIESAALTFIIPQALPERWTYARLRIWQAKGKAELDIRNFVLQWRDASLIGEGIITLDKNVQPEMKGQMGVTNYTYFVNIIADQQVITERAKFFLLSALRLLDTGGGIVTLPFLIKDRAVYLNMVRLGELPLIRWPRSGAAPRDPLYPQPDPPQ